MSVPRVPMPRPTRIQHTVATASKDTWVLWRPAGLVVRKKDVRRKTPWLSFSRQQVASPSAENTMDRGARRRHLSNDWSLLRPPVSTDQPNGIIAPDIDDDPLPIATSQRGVLPLSRRRLITSHASPTTAPQSPELNLLRSLAPDPFSQSSKPLTTTTTPLVTSRPETSRRRQPVDTHGVAGGSFAGPPVCTPPRVAAEPVSFELHGPTLPTWVEGTKKPGRLNGTHAQAQPVLQLGRIRLILDQCLQSDDACLQLDEPLSAVPVGGYTSVDKVFRVVPPQTGDASTVTETPNDHAEKTHSQRNAIVPPTSLLDAYKAHRESGKPSHAFPCGAFPSIETFWYAHERTLYLWRWTSQHQPLLDLEFEAPVVTVGAVAAKSPSLRGDAGTPDSCSCVKLLLVATTAKLSAWWLRISADGNCVLDSGPTAYTCAVPGGRVTTIVGHHSSGRLFFGDSNGGVYEFVISPPGGTVAHSWLSVLTRLAPWSSADTRGSKVTLQKVVGSPVLSRVLGQWAGGRRPIRSLAVDEYRGLIYSLDEGSNIEVFGLVPPDVSANGVIEHPLKTLAVLSHTTLTSQMTSIYHQVVRSTRRQGGEGERSMETITPQALAEKCKVVTIIPLGRHEGRNIVAVAASADGSRLFLRAKLEVPLAAKQVELTNSPEMSHFQYLKSIDLFNWKSPPDVVLSKPGATEKREDQKVALTTFLYKNRTFLYPVTNAFGATVLQCITADESDTLRRQQAYGTPENLRQPKLEEWVQGIPLVNHYSVSPASSIHVFAMYEQPLDSAFQTLLEGYGPLPGPYDVAERYHITRVASLYAAERHLQQSDDANHEPPVNVRGLGNARLSLSPWDVPSPHEASLRFDKQPKAALWDPQSLATVAQRYVPPASLLTFSATQTVPGRVFILLTSEGIYQLHQKRLLDLLQNSAEELARFGGTPSLLCRLTDVSAAAVSPSDDAPLLHSDFQSRFLLDAPPDTLNTLDELVQRSLLNLPLLSQFLGPDHVMSTCWQILTYSWGTVKWPSLLPGSTLPAGSTKRPSIPRRTPLPGAISPVRAADASGVGTPFGTPLPSYGATSKVLRAGHKGFPLALLIEAVLKTMTHPAVASDTWPLPPRLVGPIGLASQSTPFISARVRGLASFVSRILRPLWNNPIFEPVLIAGVHRDLLRDWPAVYRRSSAFSASGMSPRLFETVTTQDDMVTQNGAAKRKRRRGQDTTEDGPTVKRSRHMLRTDPDTAYLSTSKASKDVLPEEHRAADAAACLALGCRFRSEEFEKLRRWLDQLTAATHEIADRLSLGRGGQQQHAVGNAKTEITAPDGRLRAELETLSSFEAFCTIASELLSLCLLVLDLKEGRELPARTFDLLAQSSLQHLMFSPEHQEALQKLLTLHILSPSLLQQQCSHLFRAEDLELQLALQPLTALHRSVVQPRWSDSSATAQQALVVLDTAPALRFVSSPLLRHVLLTRSPQIQTGVRKLLTIAAQRNRVAQIEVLPIATLLTELQMFDTLAAFLCSLAEVDIASHPLIQRFQDRFLDLTHQTRNSYLTNPVYNDCLQKYYIFAEHVLDYYYAAASKECPAATELAERFVVACLALPVGQPQRPASSTAQDLSRRWLHYVILDWMNEVGQQSFPFPLGQVMSPAYSTWVAVHKADLGAEAATILSKFFLSHGDYSEFVDFFTGMASKTWANPKEVLVGQAVVPNGATVTAAGSQASAKESASLPSLALEQYASNGLGTRAVSSTSSASSVVSLRVAPLQEDWDLVVQYLSVTQGGLSLDERQGYLLQAKTGLHGKLSEDPNLKEKGSIQAALRSVNDLLMMVQLQINLLRQAIESSLYLFLKYRDNGADLRAAFAKDVATRQQALQSLATVQKYRYHQVRNIQSLLYMLQWRIYSSPVQLSRLIQEFAEASRDLIPVPGLALVTQPSLRTLLPDHSGRGLSRKFLIYATLACRGDLACWLNAPQLLADATAMYLTLLFSCRVPSRHALDAAQPAPWVASGYDGSGAFLEPLLQFLPTVLNVLHDAALAFHESPPPPVSAVSTTEPECSRDFDWSSRFWAWPLHIIKQELDIVDNMVAWDQEKQVEGQQKLPVLQALADAYQHATDSLRTGVPSVIPNLTASQCLALLLDIQEYWMTQLLAMCTSLPYIHLLDADTTGQKRKLGRFAGAAIGETPSSIPWQSADAGTTSTHNSLVVCLDEIFRSAPHKIQRLSDKATTLLKACTAVSQRASDWYGKHEEALLTARETFDEEPHALPPETIALLTHAFLDALDRLQGKSTLLTQYIASLEGIQRQTSTWQPRSTTPLRRRHLC